jgi:dUTP pyrophosphatase
LTLQIRLARLDPDLPLPVQAHAHDAGYDLTARTGADLAAGGGRALVPTGIAVAIPPGYAGVTCLNTPGLIDPQYRGELMVLLVNTDPHLPYTIGRGDRIAQLVITAVESAIDWVEVDQLDDTARDTFGFGSTGR